jgi:hypothetical protein
MLFALALTKTVAERSVWLDRECDGDPALRVRLPAHAPWNNFWIKPTVSSDSTVTQRTP